MESIVEMRAACGLSQSQFAKRFGVPVRTLQQWEQGRSKPPSYVLGMMEELLRRTGAARGNRAHSIPKRTTWRVCVDDPFPNCERIYPIQQRKIKDVLRRVAKDPAVRRVIVFGSSVTQACHVGSDLDVYFEMSEDRLPDLRRLDLECDAWTNYTVDDRLRNEILQKGVVVYDAS